MTTMTMGGGRMMTVMTTMTSRDVDDIVAVEVVVVVVVGVGRSPFVCRPQRHEAGAATGFETPTKTLSSTEASIRQGTATERISSIPKWDDPS
jgi:hypothetical protein